MFVRILWSGVDVHRGQLLLVWFDVGDAGLGGDKLYTVQYVIGALGETTSGK